MIFIAKDPMVDIFLRPSSYISGWTFNFEDWYSGHNYFVSWLCMSCFQIILIWSLFCSDLYLLMFLMTPIFFKSCLSFCHKFNRRVLLHKTFEEEKIENIIFCDVKDMYNRYVSPNSLFSSQFNLVGIDKLKIPYNFWRKELYISN